MKAGHGKARASCYVCPDGSGRFVLRCSDGAGSRREVLHMVFGPETGKLSTVGRLILPGPAAIGFASAGSLPPQPESVLPDVLHPGLRVVFCGTAAGRRSAEALAYYAGRGNRFWTTLYLIGLTPALYGAAQFQDLPTHGIGLTDLAKRESGPDHRIRRGQFDLDGFRRKVARYAPRIVAFNGKKAASLVLQRTPEFGQQPEQIGASLVVVLPSTSGAARRYWDIGPWKELGALARGGSSSH